MKAYRWADLRVGLQEAFVCSPSEGDMQDFRRISGDENPLHCDRDFAAARGFDSLVVYGLMAASYYSTLVGVYLPGMYCLLHGLDIHFVKPVHPGDRLEVAGEIAYLNDAYRQAEIRATISRGETLVSKAKIRVGVAE